MAGRTRKRCPVGVGTGQRHFAPLEIPPGENMTTGVTLPSALPHRGGLAPPTHCPLPPKELWRNKVLYTEPPSLASLPWTSQLRSRVTTPQERNGSGEERKKAKEGGLGP